MVQVDYAIMETYFSSAFNSLELKMCFDGLFAKNGFLINC